MSQGVKVYVGNLSWGTSDEHLRDLFSPYGQVVEAIVMRDRETQRSRGFGFVKLSSSEEADQAIASLNESDFDGRRIKVNLANTRPSGGGGGGGGGYGGGGGGYSGGGYGGSGGGYGGGGYQGGGGGYQGGYSSGGGYPPQGGQGYGGGGGYQGGGGGYGRGY